MSFHLKQVVSVYDRLVWPEGAIERQLASGERRRELVAYLGEAEYRALRPLAQAAAAAQRLADCRVYLIPGIMGSQLGIRRPAPLPSNLLWIDPVDFAHGGLAALRLPDKHVESFGPVIYSYLRLKFQLEIAGFDVRYFDYDWRRDIGELGAKLAARLLQDSASRLLLVGHSMGGLVARAALFGGDPRIERLITLGTPHCGSYAPLQALRGVYATVRRLAQLDPARSAEQLAERVFVTFPSLYQMLPERMLDGASWPASAPRPDAQLLEAARRLVLPAPPDRLISIAGIGIDTVTGAKLDGDQFRYVVSRDGDGTVPTAAARVDLCPAWYAPVVHGELPRDAGIAAAVVDLLQHGATRRLSAQAPPVAPSTASVTDEELGQTFVAKLDWMRLSGTARRAFLDSLNAPAAAVPPEST